MPRSRPVSNPISFHAWTGQYYVTRGGKRIYLGSDQDAAIKRFHRLALGGHPSEPPTPANLITCKELANRFLAAQKANWRNPERTHRDYLEWLRHFLTDHPRLLAADFTIEMFARWKLTLRRREYSPKTINHYLGAVRAMFRFAEDVELIDRAPRLNRVRNEPKVASASAEKVLYEKPEIQLLLASADPLMNAMILLAVNCGFGPKDIADLMWSHLKKDHVTLPRSKTGVSQTLLLWPETQAALERVRQHRLQRIAHNEKRGRSCSDGGRVFITKFWRPWVKDAVAEQFRKLCAKVGVPCHGFYRLRHGASTAMSLVAMPHVQRKFMRHSQLQQQVTYTHTPDAEVDAAIRRARAILLPEVKEDLERNQERSSAAPLASSEPLDQDRIAEKETPASLPA